MRFEASADERLLGMRNETNLLIAQEGEMCTYNCSMYDNETAEWFAIKTRMDFRAESILSMICDEVFFPKEKITLPDGTTRIKAVIPHVIFVKTTSSLLRHLETCSHKSTPEFPIPFWIYRNPGNNDIQPIPPSSIHLLRLLTADDTTKCRIYAPGEFKVNEHVRVTGGLYKGYTGFVKRVEKNKHVIVSIEGICMVILPFIHPDLLERI